MSKLAPGRQPERMARYTKREINQDIKQRARLMRKNPTAAEKILWERLRGKQVARLRFRRQHPIGHFIVDFYCAAARLIIEIDGAIHDQPGRSEYDTERQNYLESLDARVLRFTNDQVLHATDQVVTTITEAILTSRET